MFALSQTTGYAILALGCLRHYKYGWVQVRDIAECTKIPQPYLQKVLHTLGKAGLVRTKRGYKGGLALALPAKEISLSDVAEAIEGPRWMSDCLLGLDGTDCVRLCPTKAFWKRESRRIKVELDRLTVAQVKQYARRQGAPVEVCKCHGGEEQRANPVRTRRTTGGTTKRRRTRT